MSVPHPSANLPALSGTVLWLLPDGSRDPYFSSAIQEYAASYNAPVFIPHITVGRIPEQLSFPVSSFIAKIAEETSPFSLRTKNLECRSHPYQKLVISLFPNKKFYSLCSKIDHALGEKSSKSRDPHISLLYSHLDCNQIHYSREESDDNIPRIAEFSEIAAVEVRGRPNDWNVLVQNKFQGLR